jgi:tetratricopeptide (TPR) repeat protein
VFAASVLRDRLLEVDPLTAANYSIEGFLLQFAGRFAQAAAGPFRKAFDLDPCPPAGLLYALALARAGERERACEILEPLAQRRPGNGAADPISFLWECLRGNGDGALEVLTPELEGYAHFTWWHAWHIAAGLSMIGHADRAFPWLGRAAQLGFVHYPFLLIDPLLANVRDDPRWPEFAEELRRRYETFEV